MRSRKQTISSPPKCFIQVIKAVSTAPTVYTEPSNKKNWLVYRVDNRVNAKHWSTRLDTNIQTKLQAREQASNQIEGIQIDFDSPTYQLDNYAKLLRTIRQQLPKRYKLSVTGLLDWANQARNRQLLQLGDSIDELVMQTYQGTTTLPNYQQYLHQLEQLPFDFKVGLVEQGSWRGRRLSNSSHTLKAMSFF